MTGRAPLGVRAGPSAVHGKPALDARGAGPVLGSGGMTTSPAMERDRRPTPPASANPIRRLAWTSYGAAVGLALGTVLALATGADLAAGVGAAVGAIAGVIVGRYRERRR